MTVPPPPSRSTQPVATARESKQPAPKVNAPTLPGAAPVAAINPRQQPGRLQARWEQIVNQPPNVSGENESAQIENTKQKIATATQKAKDIQFSVALSKDDLGHFAGIQFWETAEEYIQHARMVSDIYEKAKCYAKWVIYHDSTMAEAEFQTAQIEVDNLLCMLFKVDNPYDDEELGVKTMPEGQSALRPEIMVQQLEADVRFLLREDANDERGLAHPTEESVRRLKQDIVRRQLEFYRHKMQLLALVIARVLEGKQDGLISDAKDPRFHRIAKIFLENTNKALEATYRGTANPRHKFFFLAELKNAISSRICMVVKEKPENTASIKRWLTAYAAEATALRACVSSRDFVPTLTRFAPDLSERALSYLDDIIYQASLELQEIANTKTGGASKLGKHARAGDNDDSGDETMNSEARPPPAKVQKTKEATKDNVAAAREPKPSDFTQHQPSQGNSWSAVDRAGELFIAGGNSQPPTGSEELARMSPQHPRVSNGNDNFKPIDFETKSTPALAQPVQEQISTAPHKQASRPNTKAAHTRKSPNPSMASEGQSTKRRHAHVEDEESGQQSHQKKQHLSSGGGAKKQQNELPGKDAGDERLQGQADGAAPPQRPPTGKERLGNGKLGLESYLSEQGSNSKSQALLKEDWVQKALNKQRR